MVRKSSIHKRKLEQNLEKKYHFSKEKRSIMFSLCIFHRMSVKCKKAYFFTKGVQDKRENLKFNRYDFSYLKITSCFS